jgi:endoglucanase
MSISTQGNHFVDVHGTTVQLRGVNVSGLESGIIFAGGSNFWASSGFSGRPDFTKVAAWKANVVRLPLNEDSWLGITVTGIPGNIISLNSAAYQAEVKATVAAANAAGLYVILDLHWTAPGTFAANTQNPFMNADNSINFWTSIATAFQGNKAVMFELFNEPVVCPATQGGLCASPAGSNSNALLANGGPQTAYMGLSSGTFGGSIQRVAHTYNIVGYQQAINAIRATGAANVIICGGNNYDDDLSWWTSNPVTDPNNQLAAAIHHYPDEYPNNAVTNPTGMNAMLAPIAANHPIIMTELGDEVGTNPAPFATSVFAWLDAHGYSVTVWAWNPWGGANTVIQNATSYTPTPGLGQTYHDWVLNHP